MIGRKSVLDLLRWTDWLVRVIVEFRSSLFVSYEKFRFFQIEWRQNLFIENPTFLCCSLKFKALNQIPILSVFLRCSANVWLVFMLRLAWLCLGLFLKWVGNSITENYGLHRLGFLEKHWFDPCHISRSKLCRLYRRSSLCPLFRLVPLADWERRLFLLNKLVQLLAHNLFGTFQRFVLLVKKVLQNLFELIVRLSRQMCRFQVLHLIKVKFVGLCDPMSDWIVGYD